MSGDERSKERGALRRMLLTDESIRSAGLSSLGSASQATPLTESAVAAEMEHSHKSKEKKKKKHHHHHHEHDDGGKKKRSKSTTTATEDFDQNEMEGMLQHFQSSTPTPTRSITNDVFRSDRDLLNAMLEDQKSATGSSTNGSTSEHSSSSEKEQIFQSSGAPQVTASRNAHQFVQYEQATQALPFVTGGAMLRREPSKEALLLGSVLHNQPATGLSTQTSAPSEGISKETMMLTDVTSGPGPKPQEPSRLDRFIRNITTRREGPSKESMLFSNSLFTPRASATVVSAPSARSIVTAEGLSQSDLEAGGAEIDVAHHTRSTPNSSSASPIPTQTDHSAPGGGFGLGAPRNYPRADRPGAVAMEGRAFGLVSLPQGMSRRECMRDEDTRHSSNTRSTLSLASFFSDGWDSVVQATAIEDISVIVADVVSVKKMPRRCKVIVAICLFLLLVLAGVILGAFLGSASDDTPAEPTPAPTPMPTVQMDTLVDALADTISSTEDLTTPGTAQYKASFWLANQDLLDLSWTTSPELVQRYVILVLYYATQGEGGWRTQGGWLDPSRHECDWGPSISCNSDKAVVAIDLSRNNVRGYMPSELRFLSKLEDLHLCENGIAGSIPDAVGRLTTLHMLRLNDNKLTGSIPDLGGLSALSSLDLSSNHLTGSLSEGFFELRQLRSVDLSFNRITGPVQESFGNLRYLSKVDLRNNRFTGSIPRRLMEIQDIAFLHLDNNELTGDFPLEYDLFLRKEKVTVSNNRLTGNPACTTPDQENAILQTGRSNTDDVRIREIDLSNNLFSGTVSSSCGKLTTLQRLDLSGNSFHGSIHGFPDASSLEYLDLSRNTFDGPLPADFASSLKYIDLSNNNLYGSIPQTLLDLDSIGSIDLSNNGISGNLPVATGGLLRYLNASNCDIDGTLPEDYSGLTSLEVLDLSGNRLGGSIPRQLDHLQNVRHIDLSSNVLTGQLPTHIGRMRELAVLCLSDNEISGTLPESFARLMNLDRLYLDRNHMTGSVPREVCSALGGLLEDSESARLDCNMECACCAKGVVPSCEEGLPKEDTAS
jgi:Leucine-rich repeat (LRR) protein